jgi:hypothetical protein
MKISDILREPAASNAAVKFVGFVSCFRGYLQGYSANQYDPVRV